jgi:hypothetical protein
MSKIPDFDDLPEVKGMPKGKRGNNKQKKGFH